MSSLIVEVCQINEILPHPNADRLELAKIKGWTTVVGKNQFQVGEKCIFIPPDSVLTQEFAQSINVLPYLGKLAKLADGSRPSGGRVMVAKLRGQPSYGFVIKCPENYNLGDNVADQLRITKWEPPVESSIGDVETSHPLFHQYTDIENYRNYPNLFNEDDEVIITEKIHGTSCRLGLIECDNGPQFMVGSHRIRRKPIDDKNRQCKYWACLTEQIKELLLALGANTIVFGELYGSGIQDMTYGYSNGHTEFRVFDICVDNHYTNHRVITQLCDTYEIPMVPTLYRGLFSSQIVESLSTGPTKVCDHEKIKGFAQREGIVIKGFPSQSRTIDGKFFARCILKCINFDYLTRKNGTEYH
jgi:RNA ligase (TIGR02306 family)